MRRRQRRETDGQGRHAEQERAPLGDLFLLAAIGDRPSRSPASPASAGRRSLLWLSPSWRRQPRPAALSRPLRPWSSGRASSLCARQRECSACRPARLWRRALPSSPVRPSRRLEPQPVWRQASLSRGGSRRRAALVDARAAASMSATLSFRRRPASSPQARQASRPVLQTAPPVQQLRRRPARASLRRRCTALSSPLCERRPASRPPSFSFCRQPSWFACGLLPAGLYSDRNPSADSKVAEGWRGANSTTSRVWKAAAGDGQSIALATGYRNRTGGRSGDCDFFHNVPITCLRFGRLFVNRRFPT